MYVYKYINIYIYFYRLMNDPFIGPLVTGEIQLNDLLVGHEGSSFLWSVAPSTITQKCGGDYGGGVNLLGIL